MSSRKGMSCASISARSIIAAGAAVCLSALAGPPAAVIASPAAADQSLAPWQDVTPRADLAGWHRAGGDAIFDVQNGEVIGRAVPGTPNSWLVSDTQYGDFILEYDAKTDPVLNSGMMIRGQSRPDYRNGVVHGYQAEIDPTVRRWSAGLYDEQRRQWLYTLTRNVAAQEAFRSDDWNHYRVEAIGNRLRTWINGVPAADIADDTDARGFIALQVHSISDDLAARKPEVRFRNIRIITETPKRFALPENSVAQHGWLSNRLSDVERRAGWKLLWDGKTRTGWRGVKTAGFPDSSWAIRDGTLTATGAKHDDIVTSGAYRNFELSVDFRLSPGANSGIKYLLDPQRLQAGEGYGLEYQLLDDQLHPDAKKGRDGNRTLASLYDLIPASNLADPRRPGKRINPPGEWNRAVIIVQGKHVEHWLNGFKMVEYERGSPEFRALVAQSKYAGTPGFGEGDQAPILLQDHGGVVDFRSIKLREF
ncbi:uncharacterized protein DUF1080 [Hephaestia caeni]|uniref:Uncharacterized protein DUF1080 n=1 Tax=Hephaestia caeni TaxID=645617 RepID=A0A397PD98_9SPHN|nr:DUF1080 domain-containing protein [Hephaestia caeni]RIA46948.1 uncharacterized protein DUF1080 [Hephaestia caeni]